MWFELNAWCLIWNQNVSSLKKKKNPKKSTSLGHNVMKFLLHFDTLTQSKSVQFYYLYFTWQYWIIHTCSFIQPSWSSNLLFQSHYWEEIKVFGPKSQSKFNFQPPGEVMNYNYFLCVRSSKVCDYLHFKKKAKKLKKKKKPWGS